LRSHRLGTEVGTYLHLLNKPTISREVNCGWTKKKHGFWANSHSISIPQVVYNVKFLLGIVGRSRSDFRVLFRNVLYCSMGSEHYVSLMGIGFEGFIYIMFYCSILLLN